VNFRAPQQLGGLTPHRRAGKNAVQRGGPYYDRDHGGLVCACPGSFTIPTRVCPGPFMATACECGGLRPTSPPSRALTKQRRARVRARPLINKNPCTSPCALRIALRPLLIARDSRNGNGGCGARWHEVRNRGFWGGGIYSQCARGVAICDWNQCQWHGIVICPLPLHMHARGQSQRHALHTPHATGTGTPHTTTPHPTPTPQTSTATAHRRRLRPRLPLPPPPAN
jgi:hypothetical protein